MMNREQSIRQQISELVDGELQPQHVDALLAELNDPEESRFRQDWSVYHRLGDYLRSEQMAGDLSKDFSRRLAEQLQAEPTVLAPRGQIVSGRFRVWGVALSAVAAAAMGFALSPSLFHPPASTSPGSLASVHNADAPPAASALLADATTAIAHSREADYIQLHQSANPSLYSAPALMRQAVVSSGAEK